MKSSFLVWEHCLIVNLQVRLCFAWNRSFLHYMYLVPLFQNKSFSQNFSSKNAFDLHENEPVLG